MIEDREVLSLVCTIEGHHTGNVRYGKSPYEKNTLVLYDITRIVDILKGKYANR